jgi:hypothetical protein
MALFSEAGSRTTLRSKRIKVHLIVTANLTELGRGVIMIA